MFCLDIRKINLILTIQINIQTISNKKNNIHQYYKYEQKDRKFIAEIHLYFL